jgi:Tol biopolymer transport system component
MRPRLTGLIFLMSVVALAAASTADAAFPGANGRIAFGAAYGGGPLEIRTMNPDGTDKTIVGGCTGSDPAWSPDGHKILLTGSCGGGESGFYIVNPDGTGATRIPLVGGGAPTWAPSGQKFAFARGGGVWVANIDGSGETQLHTSFYDSSPAWSPDGTKIAFGSYGPGVGHSEIYTVNPNGTGLTRLTFRPPCGFECYNNDDPDWSPDGQKIAFHTSYEADSGEYFDDWIDVINADGTSSAGHVYAGPVVAPAWSPDGKRIAAEAYNGIVVSDADGTNLTVLTPEGFDIFSSPAWQPLPSASYHHPQTASQLNVSLVPAFKPCGTGGNPSNAKHAPPLATNSCNPPRPSVLAAVGTTSQSSDQISVVPGDTDPTNGNQANLAISASLTDIQAVAGGDYNPNPSGADLTAVTRLRLTDKANGYGGLPATATEYDFKVPIDCSSTPDPSVGSTCSANTTANALISGLIQEQRQTVVQAFRVRIDDSGANGIRGDSDDRIFATQGVFVP